MITVRKVCVTPNCNRTVKARGHCGSCYNRIVKWFPGETCDRCALVLGALTANDGHGDRPLLAGAMTMAEVSAYMLGFYDRRSYPDNTIDPYIVRRLHELMDLNECRSVTTQTPGRLT